MRLPFSKARSLPRLLWSGTSSVEEWKQVVGFEGYYLISNEGRVMRIKPYNGMYAGIILRPCITPNGYLEVSLCRASKQYRRKIAPMVAVTFLGPRPPKYVVNHKDGRKINNQASNLEWITKSEDLKHAYAMGLRMPKRGKNEMATWSIIGFSNNLARLCPCSTEGRNS